LDAAHAGQLPNPDFTNIIACNHEAAVRLGINASNDGAVTP
jgi:hypothetical protein